MTDKKQELIDELRNLFSDNPDREITRAFFRTQTGIKDSSWEVFYGSWIAFKAAAGLEKTKVERKFYSDVAKHAERDELRQVNEEKQGWEGAFLRPSGDRFQTILAGSDVHGKLCDPFWRRVFVDTAIRVQPTKIVLVGDIFDFPEFSKYTNDPRSYDILGEIYWVHNFLSDLRNAAPNAEITLLEGNHSARLVRYISECAPNILPILTDIHGMGVSQLIGLDRYEVNYIAKADLSVFNENDFKKEIAKNYYIAFDTVAFHHFPQVKGWGMHSQSGHHHFIQVETFFTLEHGPVNWVQPGCGHVRNASYSMGEKWQNGFALWHVDTLKKLAQPEVINCTGSACVVGGKWYVREQEETIIT